VVLRCDPGRLQQVLAHLLGNAIKFTPAGGRVEVAVTADAREARVTVTDTGIGIGRDHHARVFEKFFQADTSSTRPYGGAGLGLAISRALVAAHGGAIGVESETGRGSAFWFTLPRR
jgi:signal transduction histidine kinase